ncbi:response regulator [Neorhizobium galegae]|uniref:response regulator n=1 Tax=Neorhizobium galegae TaxID=399 RepID=UPI0006228387|nr:response regulator [Neorhizobium galegae]CDZ63892.1 DNA-binding response regulator [Neorhizobium galegae bv. orientalis]KAB1120333.1 response regulator [Neorhizobium galegae]MCQ1809145.1 response regulator [Neorhizobium galegae]MCQ1838703.1 response regulator [Neorhizobium galegae]UIK05516.1 response regulator [Neorhizobium galegae]
MAKPMNNVASNVLVQGAARILVVEDDRDIASMLIDLIKEAGYVAEAVGSAVEMDGVLKKKEFDLIVLDGMLPGEDGFSICRRIRSSDTIPILMLTARTKEIDRVVGLELGADDYVTKPFKSRELLARIKALLRRSSYSAQVKPKQEPMTFAGWRIDPVTRELTDRDGFHVSLTTAEFDVLLVFCQNPRQVMNRQEILAHTHAGSAGPVERSIDVHVSRVRQKIEPNYKEPTFIKTVRLGGYVFTPEVAIAP